MDNFRVRCYSSIDDLKKSIKVKSGTELVEGDKIYGYVINPSATYVQNSYMIVDLRIFPRQEYPYNSMFENIKFTLKIMPSGYGGTYLYENQIEYTTDSNGEEIKNEYVPKIPNDHIVLFDNKFRNLNISPYMSDILYPVYFAENLNFIVWMYTIHKIWDEENEEYVWDDNNKEFNKSFQMGYFKDGCITFIGWSGDLRSDLYFITEPYSA